MKNLIPFVVSLFLLSSTRVATAKGKRDDVNFPMDLGWKMVYSAETKKLNLIEYLPKAGDLDHWKEIFTYQNGGKNYFDHCPEKMLNALKAQREKECPGATEWAVIEQNEKHEIATIIYGKYNRFFLHYDAKVHELTPGSRTKWVNLLKTATVR